MWRTRREYLDIIPSKKRRSAARQDIDNQESHVADQDDPWEACCSRIALLCEAERRRSLSEHDRYHLRKSVRPTP